MAQKGLSDYLRDLTFILTGQTYIDEGGTSRRLPGQLGTAVSLPVVLPSDQSPIPVNIAQLTTETTPLLGQPGGGTTWTATMIWPMASMVGVRVKMLTLKVTTAWIFPSGIPTIQLFVGRETGVTQDVHHPLIGAATPLSPAQAGIINGGLATATGIAVGTIFVTDALYPDLTRYFSWMGFQLVFPGGAPTAGVLEARWQMTPN